MRLIANAWESLLQSVKAKRQRDKCNRTSQLRRDRAVALRKIRVSKHLFRFLQRSYSYNLTIYSADEILLVATILTAESVEFQCLKNKGYLERTTRRERNRTMRVSFVQYVTLLCQFWEKLYHEALLKQEENREKRQDLSSEPRAPNNFWHRRNRDQYNRRVYVANTAQWIYAVWKLIQVLVLLPHWDYLLSSILSENSAAYARQNLYPSFKSEKPEYDISKTGRVREKRANIANFFQKKQMNVRVCSAVNNQTRSISVSRRSTSRRTPRGQHTLTGQRARTTQKQPPMRPKEPIICECSLIERYVGLHFDTLVLLQSGNSRGSQLERPGSLLYAKLKQELVVLLLAATYWRISVSRAEILDTLFPENRCAFAQELQLDWEQHVDSHKCTLLHTVQKRCMDAGTVLQVLDKEQKARMLLACIQHFTKWKLMFPHLVDSQTPSFNAIVQHTCDITKEMYRDKLMHLQPDETNENESHSGVINSTSIDLSSTQPQTQNFLSILCRIVSDHSPMIYIVLTNVLKQTNGFFPFHVRACLQFMDELICYSSDFFRTLALPEHWKEILLLYQIFQRLFESEHYEILRDTHLFLLNHLLKLSEEVQIRILQLLEANFARFFFHWSQEVRCYYQHVLLYVVYPGNRSALSLTSDQLLLLHCEIPENTTPHSSKPQEQRWKIFEKRLINVIEYYDRKLRLIYSLKSNRSVVHITRSDRTQHYPAEEQTQCGTTDDSMQLSLQPITEKKNSVCLVESVCCETDSMESDWLVHIPFSYVKCAVEEYRVILHSNSDSSCFISPLRSFAQPPFDRYSCKK